MHSSSDSSQKLNFLVAELFSTIASSLLNAFRLSTCCYKKVFHCILVSVLASFRPVVIEVSHFASLQDGKREVIVVRSDNGQKWFEHPTASATDDAAIEALCGGVSGENDSVDVGMMAQWQVRCLASGGSQIRIPLHLPCRDFGQVLQS